MIKDRSLSLLPFQRPLHPVNRYALYMPGREAGESQIIHARAKRKRSWIAILLGKREDTRACLHGAVSSGAEKNKDPALLRSLFVPVILNFRTVTVMQAALLHPLA